MISGKDKKTRNRLSAVSVGLLFPNYTDTPNFCLILLEEIFLTK